MFEMIAPSRGRSINGPHGRSMTLTAMMRWLSCAAMVPRVAGVLTPLPPTASALPSRPASTPRSSVTLQYYDSVTGTPYDAQAGYDPNPQLEPEPKPEPKPKPKPEP